MNANQEQIIAMVQVSIQPGTVIEQDKIKQLVNTFRGIYALSDIEADAVVAELESRLAVRMDRGSFVSERNHVSWYYSAKSEIDPKFWTRYRTYLFKKVGLNSDVINSIDVATDDMMDLLNNPKETQGFHRRGLVIGDVQSGKTSTYLALMNKAADAGYHIIILLTGTIEKLRRQTQGRTDEGFVGLDSMAFDKNKDSVYVGVGNIDHRFSGFSVTSTISDFNTATGNKLSGKLASITDPVVFVLKKNKSVLEKLESWLRIYNSDPGTKLIDMPLLLIDDEADNASVSTKSGDDPTAINRYIRKILKLFTKESYVGFTATPYANIFIDPDTESDMLGDDLFPRDFIYALEAPTNYIGATSVFPETGKYHYMIHGNDDCEKYTPLKHKKDLTPGDMPLSLKEAIASFMLINAIRDLRGDGKKHRTMMVNISVYIDVQKKIADQIDAYVRDIQREIQHYSRMGGRALQYSSIAFLKEVYEELFKKAEFEWPEIQKTLWSAVASIAVRAVNGGNAAKNLNYDENEDNGLRLIAVGGYSLSRGLTLEGLCVSYFYRNTKMYDTLMQMGRWFGYRPHYEDLCQIWINEDAVEWYSYISEASEELKREVRRMQAEQRTPSDFGLCVRSDNAALLVTARNKMKTAMDYTLTVSLSGQIVETPFLHSSEKELNANLQATLRLLASIEAKGINVTINNEKYRLSNKPQYLNVPKELILDYLEEYRSHTLNAQFRTSEIVGIIKNTTDKTMDFWDVVIATGTGDIVLPNDSIRIPCVRRSFEIRQDFKAYQMSGKKSRLGTRDYAMGGLTRDEVAQIVAGEEAIQLSNSGDVKPLNQNVFFKSDFLDKPRNPLLVIYPVQLIPDENKTEQMIAYNNIKIPLIGISVGIPWLRGQMPKTYQYKINLVKYRELFGMDEPEEIDETISEE